MLSTDTLMNAQTATPDDLAEILQLCCRHDQLSVAIYQRFARLDASAALREFWQEMAREEQNHVRFWEELTLQAKARHLPMLFENPVQTKQELVESLAKVEIEIARLPEQPSLAEQFILAYRLEFHLLHPAFETCFSLLGKIPEGQQLSSDNYEEHIRYFIDMLSSHGKVTTELELLGDTLLRLWHRNRQLVEQNLYDSLTGAFNRKGFLAAARPMLHYAQRNGIDVGLLFIDLDDFKQINDNYGHARGDETLTRLVRTLKDSLRSSDLICRHGGDEFLVFLFDVSLTEFRTRTEQLLHEVQAGIGLPFPVKLSAGIAGGKVEGEVEVYLERLIELADRRLYQAKKAGKNRVVGGEGNQPE